MESLKTVCQGSYGHYKPGKVMEIQNANSRPWKTIFFPKFWKSHGNVTKVASNIIYILGNRRNSNSIMLINTVPYSNET